MFIVTLESEEYGIETFSYDTKREALEGYRRLIQSSNKETAKDGIYRCITLIKDQYITECSKA